MARIRTVKPEFFRHKKLFELEKSSKLPLRVAFVGLWTAADREGRFKWDPDGLKLDCLPWDEVDFSKVLDALASGDFVVKYQSGEKFYGYIPSWSSHQVINNREMQSKIPAPDSSMVIGVQLHEDSGNTHGELEGKGTGRERKKPMPAYAGDDDFNAFWKAYPRHTSKGDALKAWKQLKPPIGAVLEALAWQRKDQEWTKDSGQWVPYPGKYLRARRWEDDKPGWAYREAKATQPAVKMEVHSHQMTKVIETYQDGSQLIECAHDGCNYRINRGA